MSSELWLANKIVIPWFLKSKIICLISWTPDSSNPFIGSSKINSFGFSMIACAIPSRCFIPSEYLRTGLGSSGFNPTKEMTSFSSSSVTWFLIELSNFKLRKPEYCPRKPGVSNKAPKFFGNFPFPMSSPNTFTVPSVGTSRPAIVLKKTLFPGPTLCNSTAPPSFPQSKEFYLYKPVKKFGSMVAFLK